MSQRVQPARIASMNGLRHGGSDDRPEDDRAAALRRLLGHAGSGSHGDDTADENCYEHEQRTSQVGLLLDLLDRPPLRDLPHVTLRRRGVGLKRRPPPAPAPSPTPKPSPAATRCGSLPTPIVATTSPDSASIRVTRAVELVRRPRRRRRRPRRPRGRHRRRCRRASAVCPGPPGSRSASPCRPRSSRPTASPSPTAIASGALADGDRALAPGS